MEEQRIPENNLERLFFNNLIERIKKTRALGLADAQFYFEYSSPRELDTIRLGLPPLTFWKYCDPESSASQIIWDSLVLKLTKLTNLKFIKVEPIDSETQEAWLTIDIYHVVNSWSKKEKKTSGD